ncbi:MAG: hypothetical protein ACXVA9_09315 [Bdellovibrionales bacterium]
MKWLGLILLVYGCTAFAADPEILGDWHYDGFFYQNHRYPNPNPELKLVFTFSADHTERLYWKRDSETGFCERKGTWEFQDDVLKQTVTWLNPDNDDSCSNDPDMQIGKATQNLIQIHETQLDLHMDLNGQDFIYILIR